MGISEADMMTTAAGTIRPAKALVLGAGIAGLQAIGTARRLGAVVTAYDVRPASRGEVESLGAKFLDLGLDFSKGQGEGGYARQLSAEEQAAQQTAVDQKAAGFDVIITTAKVPGRKPPMLLTKAGVDGLKRGAVIVDCAASDLGVSALSMRAAIQGAWLNVLINIGSLKNKELAEDYRKKGEALLAKALPLADQIYQNVLSQM
mgnify:CR=1 FL=1